ncbi:MAG: tetratricopeptide repeat protein [Nitrospiraceae bacterium]|nr:tetratricopeptide repeat protein [Nitrospiraceae bacterium]
MNREERRRQEKLASRGGGHADAMTTRALLGEGAAHHQAGRLDKAERAYLLVLDAMPGQPDALHGLGLLAYRRGDVAQAAQFLSQACARNSHNPMFHFNHGVVLQRAGRLDEAIMAYQQALRENPRYVEAQSNLGNAFKESGRLAEAVAAYEQALALRPDSADGFNNLGVALKEQGFLERAEDAYRRAIAIKPAHAEAHNNLGLALLEAGRTTQAIESFQSALRIQPEYLTALYNLGIAHIWDGNIPAALECFARTADAKHNHGRPPKEPFVYRSRLKHDAEQVQLLLEQGRIVEGWRPYLNALTDLRNRAEAAVGTSTANRMPIATADLQTIAPSFNRLLYVGPCPELPDGALNPALDCAAIEARYHARQPEVTFIDGLLTEEALNRLRDFCWHSTIWKKDYENGYIGAFLGDGFASPLLLQIAEELRARLPGIFGNHRLTQAWAFKHDSARRGLNIHADAAAVNVNFWITPDEANLNPDSGGLVVWDKEAPRDWNFRAYNSDQNRGKIYEWLKSEGAQEVKITYRANRAVLFNSDLFHETDEIAFREGLTNRRINITLLYGHRHRA